MLLQPSFAKWTQHDYGRLCNEKMEFFCAKNPELKITHREFIEMFSKHINVCKFDEKERKRMPTWKEVVLREGECPICKKLGLLHL